ncbi:MAG TPA: S16 family serine protease [Actinomycetota bacterium]
MSGRYLAALPALAFLVAVVFVPLPYYAEGPGPARDVEPRIHVSGPRTYPSQGHFVLTSVSFVNGTLPQLIQAWTDPAESVVPESNLLFPGETQEHADVRSISDMDQSKIDAAFVVLSKLTDYPKDHGAGALVEFVDHDHGCPADGVLFPGDLIVRVNGRDIPDLRTLDRVLDGLPGSARLAIDVRVGGRINTFHLTRRPCGEDRKPLLGIRDIPNFQYDLSFSSGDIGGPSAGLMWALGLYDLLTPGDLTGSRTIAGTGTIDGTGTVGVIGGVQNKIVAAQRAGADLFLVPKGNYDGAREVSGDLPLVPVSSFQEALDYLEQHQAGS